MLRMHLRILFLMAPLCIILACATTSLDENWGESFESAKERQTLNLGEKPSIEPAEGLDSQAAQNGVEEYRDSFSRKKTPASVLQGAEIRIGAGK